MLEGPRDVACVENGFNRTRRVRTTMAAAPRGGRHLDGGAGCEQLETTKSFRYERRARGVGGC